MPKSRFTEEQIIKVLKEAEAGRQIRDFCRTHGISEQTAVAATSSIRSQSHRARIEQKEANP